MGKEKPFCTIDIPTAEAAAYIEALLCTTPGKVLNELQGDTLEHFQYYFPGGIRKAKELVESGDLVSRPVMNSLTKALRDAGITDTTAPWTVPQAPTEIDGNPIDYRGDEGIRFGCNNQYNLSVEQMKLMVAKCERGGHDGGMATPQAGWRQR